MILVLGYNRIETDFLNKIFEKNNIDYKYSLVESHIIKAEKIILPEPINFNTAYKKMNMMNLFSMLRMVKKPILGINNGFRLMCNKLSSNSKCGLGFFNIDVDIFEQNLECSFSEGDIVIDENCELIDSLPGEKVVFNAELQQEAFEYSKILIRSKGKNYSLLHQNKNFYGLEIDVENNHLISEEIITNFLEI